MLHVRADMHAHLYVMCQFFTASDQNWKAPANVNKLPNIKCHDNTLSGSRRSKNFSGDTEDEGKTEDCLRNLP